ncbi:tyrosine phosphatase family-domain-containing protein [Mycena floridula]|nr:tyrosine phosphatase family-domain-containing protein [Mycena floridula]
MEALDPQFVQEALSRPPFVTISGVPNSRDLGGYTSSPNAKTHSGYIFRSGEITGIAEQGKEELKHLGISKVFDLRSDFEVEKAPVPSIDGVEIVRAPVVKAEDYSPEALAKRRDELHASGDKTPVFVKIYSELLDLGISSYGVILRHIRNEPAKSCLFHCTAGRDRTGIVAALILKIAGVSDDDVAEDYALTRIGREPERFVMMERISKESDREAASAMFECRHETMLGFLAVLQEKYGGAEGYAKVVLGLSDDDLAIIRRNVLRL